MFERNEKWIIFAVLALIVYYYFKKYGQPGATASPLNLSGWFGSLVNPGHEVGAAMPAQTTTPVLYRPAQPSTGSQMIRVGTMQYFPAPAQNIPVTRYNYLMSSRLA